MKTFFIKYFRRVVSFLKKTMKPFNPSKTAIRGAAWGILVLAALMVIIPDFQFFSSLGVGRVIVFTIFTLLLAFLAGLLGNLIIKLLGRIHLLLRFSIIAALVIIFFRFGNNFKTSLFILLYLLVFSSFAGGALWLLIRKNWKKFTLTRKIIVTSFGIIGFAGLILGVYWLVSPGKNIEMPPIAAMKGDYLPDHINLPDPAAKGSHSVLYLTYGSGNDKHRKEFAEEVIIKTEPVDGSFFVDGWEGFTGKMRSRYFGFDLKSLPRNARVWYPDGDGPFPLVLIVHGNHLAQDFSDPGYAYLGEMLATKGYILASVDQNFFNGSFTNFFKGLKSENDARGWMMLEHLKLWRGWNNDSTNVFYNKVDLRNIALIGHSRGGEAVGHAALFNKLPYYPDNAKVQFDYDFNIRSVISIAPSDGQYQPAGIRTPLRDINYFVLQGSHDADVQSYLGMKQYERIEFSPDYKGFKTSLFIYNANHGQFNTRWGRKDFGSPGINLINLRQLMPGEDQEKIAKTYISAFLDITLKDEEAYMPMFMDYRTARNWLPETIYLNRFDKSGMQYICRFNEDLDLTTTTLMGGSIASENLTVWREQMVKLKWGDKETRAAFIGWNRQENDSLTASYSISFPPASLMINRNSTLFFSLADANENSNPHPANKDSLDHKNKNTENNSSGLASGENSETENKKKKDDKDQKREPIDFTIELIDSRGEVIRFKLSDHAFLQPQLKVRMPKLSFMKTASDSEHLYHFFYFPLNRFGVLNERFSPQRIVKISLIFDQTKDGVIILDNPGFM